MFGVQDVESCFKHKRFKFFLIVFVGSHFIYFNQYQRVKTSHGHNSQQKAGVEDT